MASKKNSTEKLIAELRKELIALNDKRLKLGAFVSSEDTRDKVGYKHYLLLKRQLKSMDGYSVALTDRIALLEKQTSVVETK